MPRRPSFALKPTSREITRDEVCELIDAFKSKLHADIVLDVARASESTSDALAALLELAGGVPEPMSESASSARVHAQDDAFGGFLPNDVRDLIFARLSARDGAMLACTCREFRALVGTWRREQRHLDLPLGSKTRASARNGEEFIHSARVGSMMRAYANVSSVSFKKLAPALKPAVDAADGDVEDGCRAIVMVLDAMAASNSSHSITSIDFENCGEWLSEGDVVEVTERVAAGFPNVHALAFPRARRLTGKGLFRMLACYDGERLRELRLPGCTSLDEEAFKLILEHARSLRTLDVTGCSGLKQLRLDAHEGSRLEVIKAVNCAAMTTFSIRRSSTSSALRTVNVADCTALRLLHVQSSSLESLNAAGCRAMDEFNVFAPRCETLLLNRCAAFRAYTGEMNTVRTTLTAVRTLTLDNCKSLTSSGFDDLMRMCGATLEALSAEGCFAIDRATIVAPNLIKCSFSGSFALQVVRVSSARCEMFIARACKELIEVRFENGASRLETFDVRNSPNLKRVIGVRERRVRRLALAGCPASIEFIENHFS